MSQFLLCFIRGDEIPVLRMPGGLITKSFFEENGFNLPILVDKKDGLGMTVPPPSFTIQDVEDHVGKFLFIAIDKCSSVTRIQWTLFTTTVFVPKYFDNKLNLLFREYIFRTIKPLCAYQNGVVKNFAVVMSSVIKRVDRSKG